MTTSINKFAFVCHPAKPAVQPLLQDILVWAEQKSVQVRLTLDVARKIGRPELGKNRKSIVKGADMLVVLGGDGSILEAARTYGADKIPIAGINLGHLGFLTLDEADNALTILEKLRKGRYRIENRMMLEAIIIRDSTPIFRGIALNDVVIQKGPTLRVIKLKSSISGNLINTYHGDGLIISTPTGSTAYSLSAGGPIIPPWVDVMIVCPLNCHTLSARPVVVSDREVLSNRLECIHSNVSLVLDGQEAHKLKDNDQVEIRRAKEVAHIVVLKSRNFFEVLRKKMKWG